MKTYSLAILFIMLMTGQMSEKEIVVEQPAFSVRINNDLEIKKIVFDTDMLFEEPFTKFHMEGIAGVFDKKSITKLLSILHRIDANSAA